MSGVLGKIVYHVGDVSCSLIPGRGCFGDIPGGGVVESPSPPFVERLSRTVQVALSFAPVTNEGLRSFCRRCCLLNNLLVYCNIPAHKKPQKVTVDGVCVLSKSGKYRWEWLNRFPWRRRRSSDYEVSATPDGMEVTLGGKLIWGATVEVD